MTSFVDGREQSDDVLTDLCIVGAGAAGISVALELIGAPFDVVVLEAGGLVANPDDQELYRGAQLGLPTDELHHNRVRAFGGTTALWGGYCRPLDAIDFERRDWVPHSGWPFGCEALEPHYHRAAEICEVDPVFDARSLTSEADHRAGTYVSDEVFENIVFQLSPPTRFGERYKAVLQAAKNVAVYLHSSAVGFALNADGSAVQSIKASNRKTTFNVKARHYVLATGTVENARLLLNADDYHRSGLGNAFDRVGRFFMQHPDVRKLEWLANSETDHRRLGRQGSGARIGVATRLAPAAQRRHQLLNQHLLQLGVETLGPRPRDWLKRELRKPAADRAARTLVQSLGSEQPGDGWTHSAALMERPEQAPNPDSRITLGEERDALGLRRVAMDWRLTELDVASMLHGHRLLAQWLGVQDAGRLKGWPPDFDPRRTGDGRLHGGHHHMGTTRMHSNPREGVVDAQCRVHDVSNLFVAGASVFPTSGYTNPTFTIVALAVRLAQRLRRLATEVPELPR